MENIEWDNEKSLEDVYKELKAIPPERLTDEQKKQIETIEQGAQAVPAIKKIFGALFDVMEIAAPVFMEYGKEYERTHKSAPEGEKKKIGVMEFQPVLFDALKSWSKNEGKRAGVELTAESLRPYLIAALNKAFGGGNKSGLRQTSAAQPYQVMEEMLRISPEGMTEYVARKNSSRGSKYFIKRGIDADGKEWEQLKIQGTESAAVVRVNDVSNLTGTNRDTRRILKFSIEKMNEMAFFRGNSQHVGGKIAFSLNEMVNEGLYNSPLAARRGFLTAANILTGVKFGSFKDLNHKNPMKTDAEGDVLFTGYSLKGGICTLKLNPEYIFDRRAETFTILPGYYYALGNRPGMLCNDIFYYARQSSNLIKIARDGRFAISVRTLQANFGLPGLRKTDKPGRDIRGEIERTAAELMAENAHYRNPDELKIIISDEKTAREFMENGKITVIFSGELLEYFKALAIKNAEKQAEIIARRKAKRITDKKKIKGATK